MKVNDFRSSILGGKKVAGGGLLTSKSPRNKAKGDESLASVSVARSETRIVNHRGGDRHYLSNEQSARARHGGKQYEIRLINLSGGGAMIEAPFRPDLWDRVELDLGDGESSGKLECAVRWIKNDRIGLEFAHETRIDADATTREGVLRQVLDTSFPDAGRDMSVSPPEQAAEPELSEAPEGAGQSRRGEDRHPLIWCGEIHWDHDTHPVRLRNISASGALVEGGPAIPIGAELLLDLDEAGTYFATMSWARGDQAGLTFRSPFDLAVLAKTKPKLAPRGWAKPTYLRDESTVSSPWAAQWGRLSLADLYKTLGRG